ncbi:hypothetical protein QQF64_009739 [Cirrhinus molitorella]|uniref:TNFR-Cys domain-containing protein n=1 Tax=Cirrhinus molitorella TaxID=172907 RepID=A0ABR3M203_9TELE
MLALLSVLLLSSHVLPLVQSLRCNERTEYLGDNRCCKKCEPGQFIFQKCKPGGTETDCKTCGEGFYMDDYNGSGFCHYCAMCTKDHMRIKKSCTATSNTVCTCEEGYRCSDSNCQACEKIPTTTVSTTVPRQPERLTTLPRQPERLSSLPHLPERLTTLPRSATPFTKTIPTTNDNVWISVSLCYACVCVCVLLTCLILISRHARQCGWIMSASTGLCRSNKSNSGSSQCTEEEEVPMPVQEMCGTSEKLEDV